jgi:hypothetical protein
MTKPLWDCLLVENYRDDDGAQSAFVTRGLEVSPFAEKYSGSSSHVYRPGTIRYQMGRVFCFSTVFIDPIMEIL